MAKDSTRLRRTIKLQRITAGMTLRELSVMSGVSVSHLGSIERGETFPSARTLRRLAKPLCFKEAQLFILAGYDAVDLS